MLFRGEISTLAELVSPMTQQDFFDCYTQQLPIFIHGGTPSRVAKLVNVNEISDLIQKETFPGGRIVVSRSGESIPPRFYTTRGMEMNLSLIRGILDAGASLAVNGLQDTHPKIGDLAQALELELSSYVWANAYVTTKEGGAFKIHYDDHDVIALQISGAKRWHLYGRTEEFPVRQFDSARDIAPTVEEEIDTLRAGEVLFVPRGVWHRAEVVDSPSFHITFGIAGETGIQCLKHALDDLSKEALFRKYLPRVGGEHLLSEHEKKLKAYLHDWVERLSAKTFLASRDADRAARSDVIPWTPIQIGSEAKIWLALRRRSPIVDLDSTEIVVGGKAHHVGSTDRLILQIVEKYGILRFDELVSQVHLTADAIAEAELVAAVTHLTECGLLNVSMDSEGRDHAQASESNQDITRGSMGLSKGRSHQETA